jgi:D-alanyl-D-alanine carboxypeptidase (penicillin-binding protein 5/6)
MPRFFLSLFIVQFLFALLSPPSFAMTAPPAVTADGAILIDSRTGSVLFDKNSDRSLAPASTTKIMTAIIAIESGLLEKKTVISENAAKTEGSSLNLKAGDAATLRDLLTGLLLRSGNDCAVAIAEAVAGSEEEFVKKMNSKAALIGALDTAFKNPHGLPNPNHRSTAADLAKIARYAMRLSEFSAIVNSKNADIAIDLPDEKSRRHLKNTNKLLWLLPEADGIKTGTTSEAGPCLVASATKDGWQLIAVTLNDKERWQDSASLLIWGFENFTLFEYDADGAVDFLPVSSGMADSVGVILKDEPAIVVEKNKAKNISTALNLPKKISAPVYQGQKVGSLDFILDGSVVKAVDLEADKTIEERTLGRFIANQLSLLLRFLEKLGFI